MRDLHNFGRVTHSNYRSSLKNKTHPISKVTNKDRVYIKMKTTQSFEKFGKYEGSCQFHQQKMINLCS